jgi:GT2 family glycosyltransferase
LNNKILIIIVLYEKKLSESESFQTLMQVDFPKNDYICVIWDNSNKSMLNIELQNNFEYFFNGKNESLSIVYNTISKKYENQYNYLVIFDDDSSIPTNFFKLLKKSIDDNKNIELFVPKIFNKKKLVSPGKINYVKGSLLQNISTGVQKTDNITVISSGICISNKYIKENNYKLFDERLNLYGIDTLFMKNFRKKNRYFYVLDIIIEHDTSLRNEPSVTKLAKRYDNLLMSWLIVYSDSIFEKILIRCYVLYHIFKFSISHRSLVLIKLMSGYKNDR